MYNIYFIYYVI